MKAPVKDTAKVDRSSYGQCIVTKYLGATDCRGARVVARAQAGRVTVAWDDALGVNENHDAAAEALCAKFGWTGRLTGGGLPDGTGNAYAFWRGAK